MIDIEVAFALPRKQKIISLQVPQGTSVYQAVLASNIADSFTEINLDNLTLGIFGKLVRQPEKQEVLAGQRVEIYRPLIIDPKTARANRAAKAAKNKK